MSVYCSSRHPRVPRCHSVGTPLWNTRRCFSRRLVPSTVASRTTRQTHLGYRNVVQAGRDKKPQVPPRRMSRSDFSSFFPILCTHVLARFSEVATVTIILRFLLEFSPVFGGPVHFFHDFPSSGIGERALNQKRPNSGASDFMRITNFCSVPARVRDDLRFRPSVCCSFVVLNCVKMTSLTCLLAAIGMHITAESLPATYAARAISWRYSAPQQTPVAAQYYLRKRYVCHKLVPSNRPYRRRIETCIVRTS